MPGQSSRDVLAQRLRELRAPRFRSGSALARHLGWQQNKVSRIELGHQLPSRADLDRWAHAVNADPDELHQLLDDAHVQIVSSRTAARNPAGLSGAQDELAALEQASRLIAEYQPHMIPGLAQTAVYARTWLSRPTTLDTIDIDAVVQARLARQAILYQPHHQIVIALGEAALRNIHGDKHVHRQQLGHLHVIAELPTVELLIEPATTAMAVMRGFEILDDRVILEDTDHARHLTEPTTRTRFTTALNHLRDHALTATPAADLIRTIEHSI